MLLVLATLLLLFLANAGKLLVVNDPQKSDVIVALAGETEQRPTFAVQLLDQGYARQVVLDVPASEIVFGTNEMELAQKYVRALPEAGSIDICPIVGLSTRDEAHDVAKCLQREAGSKILLVTSDYHTRRALSIFRHELPQKSFSVAAARDETQFGARWWTNRQWAKTMVYEWLREAWWVTIDRWR